MSVGNQNQPGWESTLWSSFTYSTLYISLKCLHISASPLFLIHANTSLLDCSPNPPNYSPWTHMAALGTFYTQWSELLEHEIYPDASNFLTRLLRSCMSWPFLGSPPAPHHYALLTSVRLNASHDSQHTTRTLSHLWASKFVFFPRMLSQPPSFF